MRAPVPPPIRLETSAAPPRRLRYSGLAPFGSRPRDRREVPSNHRPPHTAPQSPPVTLPSGPGSVPRCVRPFAPLPRHHRPRHSCPARLPSLPSSASSLGSTCPYRTWDFAPAQMHSGPVLDRTFFYLALSGFSLSSRPRARIVSGRSMRQ